MCMCVCVCVCPCACVCTSHVWEHVYVPVHTPYTRKYVLNCMIMNYNNYRIHNYNYSCRILQSNLTIMNPGYNEFPDITNIDLRMYTY